ncbi:MAG: glycosyltransferase, partial [Flammeovirgaceae bacterium]|nr:glycosyltransferase [Flammeovirgaceae bacterium]
MKILILGPAFPYRGGIADTNEALCRALLRIHHDSSIITFTFQYPSFLFPGKTQYSVEPAPPGLTISRLINSINPFNWIGVAKKINELQPDLIVIRYWIPFLAPCFGTIARLLRKKIEVVGLCDNIIPHEPRFYDPYLTRYFINSCNKFITLSQTVYHELRTFTKKPCVVIPHPINDQLEKKVDKPEARKKLGLDEEGEYVLFFGLVRKYKGLDLLMAALNDEQLRSRNVKLIIAGEFYDDPEIYLRMIRQSKLEDHVLIHNQFIAASD